MTTENNSGMISPMDLTVTREEGLQGGRYVARAPGVEGEAELTYTKLGTGLVSADHTEVPPSMEGQGVGKALLDALLHDARKLDFRIEPRCAYVRAQYAKHPDWVDLFVTDPGA